MNLKAILASSSPYRAAQMHAAGIPFETFSPDIDETPVSGENGEKLARRLAREKCTTGARKFPQSVVIGSDQVGVIEGRILSKPGTAEANIDILHQCQGSIGHFYTALSVFDPTSSQVHEHCNVTELRFRTLDPGQIERYVALDRAWDCAGGFKIESAGIGLFEYVRSDDPTALQGLPMIALFDLLHQVSFEAW